MSFWRTFQLSNEFKFQVWKAARLGAILRAVKKELFLLIGSSILSILIALAAFYYFYPHTFRRPVDMEIVQLQKKLPPFYMGVFRAEDIRSSEPILKDPISNVRGKPFLPEIDKLGPHDALGFRNRDVPQLADVVTIGDSQTYGMNATLLENWPSRLEANLKDARVYNMSLGGFSAPQYLQLVEYATVFKPQAIVLALYSGNDPLESFRTVYNISFWKTLRTNPDLSNADAPETPSPLDQTHWWKVSLGNRAETIFTPRIRLSSHLAGNKAVQSGYEIIATVLEKISRLATVTSTPVILTVIPSKELIFYPRLKESDAQMPDDYRKLVQGEEAFLELVGRRADELDNVTYVDLSSPLQKGVMKNPLLYPPDQDGHPMAAGYQTIADVLTPAVQKQIKQIEDGFYAVPLYGAPPRTWYFVVRDNKRWQIPDPSYLRGTVYESSTPEQVPFRLLERFPLASLDYSHVLQELRRN